jgi:tetratricopeptide (TPR) repeat protein
MIASQHRPARLHESHPRLPHPHHFLPPPVGSGMTPPRLEGLDNEAAQRVVAAAQALALGRADQAAAQLLPLLAAYPSHPEVLRLHAGILNLQGDQPAARKAMERAVALRPMDALYRNTLGAVLGASGDFDGAIRALRRACELEPGLAAAWYNLGVMLTRCVRNDEATEALKHAVSLAPDNMDARALLADLLRMQGRTEQSISEYRKVLSEDHGPAWRGGGWPTCAAMRWPSTTSSTCGRP